MNGLPSPHTSTEEDIKASLVISPVPPSSPTWLKTASLVTPGILPNTGDSSPGRPSNAPVWGTLPFIVKGEEVARAFNRRPFIQAACLDGSLV